MDQMHISFGIRKAVAVAALAAYLTIACGVDLFHTEDCPLTHGKTAPSSESCPACKFLAGANATEALHDSGPVVLEHSIISPPAPGSHVTVSKHWATSIALRGPPSIIPS